MGLLNNEKYIRVRITFCALEKMHISAEIIDINVKVCAFVEANELILKIQAIDIPAITGRRLLEGTWLIN